MNVRLQVKVSKPILVFASVFALFMTLSPLKAEGIEYKSNRKITGFDFNMGIEQSFWNINHKSQCDTCVQGVVDYETEGLSLYRVNGDLKVWDHSLINFYYEQPFNPSENQKEILRVNKSQTTGSEKYAVGLALDPIARRYFSDRRILNLILRRVVSIKIKQTREIFWGNAKANQNSIFVPLGTSIDYQNLTILNGIPISAGDTLAFRTVFSDQEISMALWYLKFKKFNIAESALRVGYYRSKWERMSDARLSTLSSNPVIYEAKFRSQGILVSLESDDVGEPGLNYDVIAKWGTKNSLDSAIEWERIFGEDIRVQTNLVEFGVWYNFYVNKKTREGLSLSAGGTMDLRDTKVQITPGLFDDPFPATATANSDTIFKLFLTAGYRF